MIDVFNDFINQIQDDEKRQVINDLLKQIQDDYPELEAVIKWNQPMFTHHGTYIIGLSLSKHHFALSPEQKTIQVFSNEIIDSGYEHSKMIIRFPWKKEINYQLIKKMIEYNINDKMNEDHFWRQT
ncbi:iron chaperone [Hujiaoplasma nucleasis]|uniref:iron chaperone n=1 Tax=Hujiaoplasma nucleasis TaxID=2725268 RepID=UPI00289736F2|nr:DUF1801 domain-containing protein [Hujiaoplasma nucleasis]